MKNYAYMIFLTTETATSHSITHPQSTLSLARLTSKFHWHELSLHMLYYSLRSIILFAIVDVSRHILVVDTSVLGKSNMSRREYYPFNLNIYMVPTQLASW
jgi:hypothetical protein